MSVDEPQTKTQTADACSCPPLAGDGSPCFLTSIRCQIIFTEVNRVCWIMSMLFTNAQIRLRTTSSIRSEERRSWISLSNLGCKKCYLPPYSVFPGAICITLQYFPMWQRRNVMKEYMHPLQSTSIALNPANGQLQRKLNIRS